MKYFVLICGILLLIGGLPLVWKFAAGTARIILSVLVFIIAVGIILWGISLIGSVL